MENIENTLQKICSYEGFIDIELLISPNNQREKFFDSGLINIIIKKLRELDLDLIARVLYK